MTATHNLPCAAAGLVSYRYVGPYGYIMIGATDDRNALGEARRSLEDGKPDMAQLERWDGSRYVRVQPIKPGHEHCQICGRHIKAKLGVIAHHGYQRPHGEGWQTASCAGARHQPYEVSCDALPPAISSCENYIASQEAALALWIATPPAGIMIEGTDKYGNRRHWPKSMLRPAGFDPDAPRHTYNSAQSYEWEYDRLRQGYLRRIKLTSMSLEFFRKRLADWKPPHG